MTVSVIIPAFDVAAVIGRAIASVLAQTRPAREIIVVDDASRDRTGAVVEKLAASHPEIKLISLPRNRGPAHARNRAIAEARGDWVAILDADDAWRPNRLERLLAVVDETGADFIADNLILFDSVAAREVRTAFAADGDQKILDAEALFRGDTIGKVSFNYGGLKPLLRRAFLAEKNLSYDESLRFGEDFKLYAELIFSGGKAVLTSEAFYVFSTATGLITGRRSPHSRTSPRFDVLVATSDSLREKYRALITPDIADAMERRRAQLMLIHKSNVARGLRVWRTFPRYVGYVLGNPDLLFFLARRLRDRRRAAALMTRLNRESADA